MTAGLDVFAPTFTGEVHFFAAQFPMIPDDELTELADNIKANGQLHPILLDRNGVLLDGRNRLLACQRAGVEPVFAVHTGDPLALIVAANVDRRQMSKGQQAIARGIALAEQGKRKNGRWEYGANVSNETISRKAMMQAGLVIDHDTAHGTDYAQQVLLGELTLDGACTEVKKAAEAVEAAHRELQAQAARRQELAEQAPDLLDLVGETHTLDMAWVAYQERDKERIEKERRDRQTLIDQAEHLYMALTILGSHHASDERRELLTRLDLALAPEPITAEDFDTAIAVLRYLKKEKTK